MKARLIAAMAMSLATTATTPICLAQSSASEHDQADQQKSHKSSSSSETATPKEIRASKLLGINVTSKDGDNLGQVQDLVFNPHTGQIRFALVGKGFMAGSSQSLIPVPWQAVKVRSEREFTLNVDKEKMKGVPSWSQTEMDQPEYVIRVYRFYEIEPQADVGGLGSSSTESGTRQGSSSSTQSDSDQAKEHKE